MKQLKITIVIFFLFLITITCNSQSSKASFPFFFIQVTDPQFGMFESDNGFGKETELYEKAIHAINKLNPGFVVITGDLVNKKEDRLQIAEFKRITAMIKSEIPVYYSPGNHDIGQSPSQKDIDTFISDIGNDKFSFLFRNCLFIGLNSCIIKANTPVLEQAQFEWLKQELSKNRSVNHIILFSHYPFFIKSFDEPETYSNMPVQTRQKYFTLFKEANVDAIFAGHLHNNGVARFENIQMVTSGAVGKPLANVPSGIRVIKVWSEKIESAYYSLDEIPETIELK